MSARVFDSKSHGERPRQNEGWSSGYDDEDPLGAAKAVVFGVLLSSVFWVAMYVLVKLTI